MSMLIRIFCIPRSCLLPYNIRRVGDERSQTSSYVLAAMISDFYTWKFACEKDAEKTASVSQVFIFIPRNITRFSVPRKKIRASEKISD